MARTVLITGASSGFGQAAARLFAERGWNVIATMRDIAAGECLRELPNLLVTGLDVEDVTSIGLAISHGLRRFNRIDVLVNNAGYGLFGIFEETSDDRIAEQFRVNLFGVMHVTRSLLPHFRSLRSGVIINISSGAGVFGLPLMSPYCASKFAVEGFSEALSYELSSIGIYVKIIEPGGVSSTGFADRLTAEAAGSVYIPDYDLFRDGATAVFGRLLEGSTQGTPEQVAETIFAAATDGSDRLRYVATPDILPMVEARRGTSEERYMAVMRNLVMPPSI